MNRCQHVYDYGVQVVKCSRPATRDDGTKCGFHSDEYKARCEEKRQHIEARRVATELQEKARKALLDWAVELAKDADAGFAEAWKQMEAMVDG